MKPDVELATLFQEYARTIVSALPGDWHAVAVYKEAKRGPSNELSDQWTMYCWTPEGARTDIFMPLDEYSLFERIFDRSQSFGDAWGGMLFYLERGGRFDVRFYYDGTPLLDGDDSVARRRVQEYIGANRANNGVRFTSSASMD